MVYTINMDHNELIRKFRRPNFVIGCNECSCSEEQCGYTHKLNHIGRRIQEATLKVIDLHKPSNHIDAQFETCDYCKTPYPCRTTKLVMEVMEDVHPELNSSIHK
jgi:hypothetical protein